jgi:putative ABC transport system permease protein
MVRMIAAIRNSLFIAWRYLAFHRLRSLTLVAALAVILFVPLFLELVVRESRAQLTARADTTPMVLGAPGSSLDLVLNSLYFTRARPQALRMSEVTAIDGTGLARAIPLNTRFWAGAHPIVGTTLDYFEMRGLNIAAGRPLAILGEAVVGHLAARALEVEPGDSVISSPEDLFNLAGQYPLKLNIVGVLGPAGSPDDKTIFVDVRTSWIIEGLGHGHDNLATTEDPTVILKRDPTTIVANAKLRTHNVITAENLGSFHFHGDPQRLAVTAALVVPKDDRAGTILLGRHAAQSEGPQLVRPGTVVQGLIETIFRIKTVLDAVTLVVGLATLLTVVVIFMLSWRLREKELVTVFRLGCSRGAIAGFVIAEIFLIAAASLVLCGGFLAGATIFQGTIIERIIG